MAEQILTFPNVFTLEEVANYLKLSTEIVEQLAQNGKIPCRRIESSWRFLRTAIDDWLTGRDDIFDTGLLETNSDHELINTVRQLPVSDKIRLLRVLAEELETTKKIFPFEKGKTYQLSTPYNSFGAGQALMDAMGSI
ncbi:helix-turn-helix domain-containing protein [Anaerolineales bacterium HSG6]|nr:helix-turn-helix domain-containing protein [Anaerolineales bacterium HSG6]MDM8530900.1 helix-turn-helix domain-containing protein [Anaerolineales bacterium HSG25]